MILTYIVDHDTQGKQVKWIMKHRMNISGRLLNRLKNDSKILINDQPVFANTLVLTGDIVKAVVEFEETFDGVIPQNLPLDILFEDDYLIAINKQTGMVVHPSSNHPCGTIANGLVQHFMNNGLSLKARPVSRLDRDTTGVIVFAKNQFVQEQLIKTMRAGAYKKFYVGAVWGIIQDDTGKIDLPIDRAPGSIILRHVSPEGSNAVTHYKVLRRFENATLLEFELETGRTHQIRVHCQAIGHSLIGDTLYSDVETGLILRQALHSILTEFPHPVTQTLLKLEAKVPDDFDNLLEELTT